MEKLKQLAKVRDQALKEFQQAMMVLKLLRWRVGHIVVGIKEV